MLVLQSKETLEKLDKVTPCRYGAMTCLLVCSDKNIAWAHGDYSTWEMDATIVATHMILEAENVGVDSVWVRNFDAGNVQEVFGLPKNVMPVCMIMLGQKVEDFPKNPLHDKRKDLAETVQFL